MVRSGVGEAELPEPGHLNIIEVNLAEVGRKQAQADGLTVSLEDQQLADEIYINEQARINA
eukprot:gene26593-33195_t